MQQKLILCTSSFRHPYSLLLGHYRTTTAKSSKKIPKIKLKNMLNKTKSYNHWLRNVPQGTGTSNFIACQQALQVTLMARWEKEVELATTSLEFNFHLQFPCGSQSTGSLICANQCEVETSTKVNKHWKTQAKGNDVITDVISTNQHFASTFSMRYSNSTDVVASSPSFFHPPPKAPQRACS